MDFFKKIINAVSPQLDEEQSNIFQQQAKVLFAEELDRLLHFLIIPIKNPLI